MGCFVQMHVRSFSARSRDAAFPVSLHSPQLAYWLQLIAPRMSRVYVVWRQFGCVFQPSGDLHARGVRVFFLCAERLGLDEGYVNAIIEDFVQFCITVECGCTVIG